MSSSTVDAELDVRATGVTVTDETITVELDDGRTVSMPTAWCPRLLHATPQERANYEIRPLGIEWPDVEADFSIRGLLLGRKSGESPACFNYWLENRRQGRRVTVEQWLNQRLAAKRAGSKGAGESAPGVGA